MSETRHIFIFTIRNAHFAVDAVAVREIVWLPKLAPVEEVPAHIAGVFNLRGRVIPVMDLDIGFGRPQRRYGLSDMVVVIQSEAAEGRGKQAPVNFGVIVDKALDIAEITKGDIEPSVQSSPNFVVGEVKLGADIVMLLDHENLARSFNSGGWSGHALATTGDADQGETPAGAPRLHSQPSAEEIHVFQSRALNLMQPAEGLTLEGFIHLAVIGLNREYYGVDLKTVREFTVISGLMPVPCTPAHIVGDMNLRGDILTLVDISVLLDIPARLRPEGLGGGKAVVTQINDLLAGVAVDEVYEVIYVSPADIRPVPTAVKGAGNEFISGEVPYAGKMLSILDLERILTMEELVVDEPA